MGGCPTAEAEQGAVNAVADQRGAPPELLPPLDMLTIRQQSGIDCARCGQPIGVHARELGTVPDHRGNPVPLLGCAVDPPCLPVRWRGPGSWWPPPGAVTAPSPP